ncbi:Alpha/Beta hydrolase fold [Vigna unguiculata]|uniref:Alpha/Beta hydrolase fold n=1 Tax=Vigna unguiculata TaxID=3917 RepID=A0A4D6KXS2_VIGUN|nr:Alpha/Beta hydrolase fold [Vigna unguiculata]
MEHHIRTGCGSVSVIVYEDPDKPTLITYLDLAPNSESTPSQPSIDQPIPSQPPIVQPVQPYVNEPTPSSMASQCVGARLTSLPPLNKMIHQPQYPLDLFIMYFKKTNTCLPKKQVNHP